MSHLPHTNIVRLRIPGGSEDVLFDLAIRQLVKQYSKLDDAERALSRAKL